MRIWPAALSLFVVAGCASPSKHPIAPAPSTMRVNFIDVGQGAATLFEFADGAVLVDTGGEDNATVHSDAMLGAYLDRFFEGRPDLHHELSSLILTHPHIDHTRGVSVVLANDLPRNVVTNGQTGFSRIGGRIDGARSQNSRSRRPVGASILGCRGRRDRLAGNPTYAES